MSFGSTVKRWEARIAEYERQLAGLEATIATLEARVEALVGALEREHGRQHSITDYAFAQHDRCYCEKYAEQGMPHGCHSCAVLANTPAKVCTCGLDPYKAPEQHGERCPIAIEGRAAAWRDDQVPSVGGK